MSALTARWRASSIRLWCTVRPGDGASELDSELEAHVAMPRDAGIAERLRAAEARRQALGAERCDVLLLVLKNAAH